MMDSYGIASEVLYLYDRCLALNIDASVLLKCRMMYVARFKILDQCYYIDEMNYKSLTKVIDNKIKQMEQST